MMHPCFLCGNKCDLLGNTLPEYAYWESDTLTESELAAKHAREQQQFDSWIQNTPEVSRLFDELVIHIQSSAYKDTLKKKV